MGRIRLETLDSDPFIVRSSQQSHFPLALREVERNVVWPERLGDSFTRCQRRNRSCCRLFLPGAGTHWIDSHVDRSRPAAGTVPGPDFGIHPGQGVHAVGADVHAPRLLRSEGVGIDQVNGWPVLVGWLCRLRFFGRVHGTQWDLSRVSRTRMGWGLSPPAPPSGRKAAKFPIQRHGSGRSLPRRRPRWYWSPPCTFRCVNNWSY